MLCVMLCVSLLPSFIIPLYQVVSIFIEIVETLGDYVFSDFRTYKLIPILLDTIIEFIYGPCLENQIFLGKWKKLINVINTLIN